MRLGSAFDPVAPSFDRHRMLPGGVPEAIRAAILAATGALSRPRLLDLGAGTGRIGWPFVIADDDYTGVDLSLGMLRQFARRACDDRTPRLVHANGEALPFRDATFDAVMLIQIIGAAQDWRQLVDEARRVLRPEGVSIIGRTVTPSNGLDAQMKQRLASLLDEMGVTPYQTNSRRDVQGWLEAVAQSTRVVPAAWSAELTPLGFLERQSSGARFFSLPESIKEDVLRKLRAWAAATFGSLDAKFTEEHVFELQVFKFRQGTGC
jgi:ubiquinone/menaquinone biosynthesis C-methylase UbiE